MDEMLYNYDVYPKVVRAHNKAVINIAPIGWAAGFDSKKTYAIRIRPTDDGHYRHYPSRNNDFTQNVTPDDKGALHIEFDFGPEEMYFIDVFEVLDEKRLIRARVYAVEEDLWGRYPFMGDMHMHTARSDGREAPAVVAANYRKMGLDFLAITDHQRYYPSLEAMDAFKDVPIEFNLMPGEEVHLSRQSVSEDYLCDPHIVNFGGEFSINALVRGAEHTEEVGEDLSKRAIRTDDVPDCMDADEFWEMIKEKAKDITDLENPEEKVSYACMKWIFDTIRKANGLGIFAHPYWFSTVRQLPEEYTEYIMDKQDFDAFEVCGGENYFEHNGFQIVRYYEDKAKGRDYPIVSSTDSHGSLPTNRNRDICKTMVFARENERKELIASIKAKYSVALDTISKEPRYVGDMRLVRYACFLGDCFFPLHDELCFEEGRAMREYACGDKFAADELKAISGRMKRQREKYFDFG